MEIEELFKDFTVNGEKIPVARVQYTGSAKKYVVYSEIDNRAGYFADGATPARSGRNPHSPAGLPAG